MMEYRNNGILEYWNDGRMERNALMGCRLQVRGKDVLRCCCNAVLQFMGLLGFIEFVGLLSC